MIAFFSLGDLVAQEDSVKLSNAFEFRDGIYLSYKSFRENRPDHSWEEVGGTLVLNSDTWLARLTDLEIKEGGKSLSENDLWGFSRDGVPYIRLDPQPEPGEGVTRFAGLQYCGRICYYAFEREVTRMVTITAYNPLTGKPFRKGKVPRKESVYEERILHFPTGREAPLNRENLLNWIVSDAELAAQIRQLEGEELDLIRVMQTFDRRNPVFMTKD